MNQELETDRGHVLRRWEDSDAPSVLQAFADPLMARQTDRPVTDLDAAKAWIAAVDEGWGTGSGFSWAIVSDRELLGSVMVSSVDRRHDVGWVSYWTCPEARGKGVASAALRAMSAWAFTDLGLFRLELGHRVNNPESCRVALAAGYRVEGLEREKLRYGDKRFDVELHARLASDPMPRAD